MFTRSLIWVGLRSVFVLFSTQQPAVFVKACHNPLLYFLAPRTPHKRNQILSSCVLMLSFGISSSTDWFSKPSPFPASPLSSQNPSCQFLMWLLILRTAHFQKGVLFPHQKKKCLLHISDQASPHNLKHALIMHCLMDHCLLPIHSYYLDGGLLSTLSLHPEFSMGWSLYAFYQFITPVTLELSSILPLHSSIPHRTRLVKTAAVAGIG